MASAIPVRDIGEATTMTLSRRSSKKPMDSPALADLIARTIECATLVEHDLAAE
jgi:hypothetical protein